MPEGTNNKLIYKTLSQLHSNHTKIQAVIRKMKVRIASVIRRLGLVHTEVAQLSERMDQLESRVARIEIRLNLNDNPD